MRIVILSVETEGQFGLMRYFERALRGLGHDVEMVTIAAKPTTLVMLPGLERTQVALRARQVVARVDRLRLERRVRRDAAEIARSIRDKRPDFVVFSKGTGRDYALVRELDALGVPVFDYYPDPLPLGDADFVRAIPHFAAILTYSLFQIPAWYLLGARSVHYLPFASDASIHRPMTPEPERLAHFRSPVAYLATWQPHAEYWPERLARFGLKIWGNQWFHVPASSPARAAWQGESRGTYGELALVCGASDIVFNAVRAHNGSSHSMKTFEIPACGAFMLGNRTEEQLSFFPEDQAAAYFSTEEELLDKAAFYLRDERARRAIAAKGLELAQHHRYEHRMNALIEIAKKVLGARVGSASAARATIGRA
jgi:spore maturation protein CgeB